MWTGAQIEAIFDIFEQDVIEDFIQVYQYIGEEFTNQARRHGAYTDRTGNLRSSVGYAIFVDGDVIAQNIEADGEALRDTQALIEELRTKWGGIVLIGFAGMNYAAAVESKGYDVITGSAPTDGRITTILNQLVKRHFVG